ncbi:MAG: RecX family transcriptional regulator [Clostridia bacterium]|nr:RecX family transcriptional regulator [Clostridia bacterium]
MFEITDIAPQQKGTLLSVFVNKEFSFSADAAFLADNDVFVGRKLEKEELETLRKAAEVRKAIRHSLYLLEHRDFSKKELAKRLETKGYDPSDAMQAAEYIEDRGYINDKRYAERMIERKKGKAGKKQLRFELKRAGISGDDAEAVLEETYSESDGINAVLREMKRILKGGFPEDRAAQKKLFNRFIAKGYEYETVRAAYEKYCENEE